MGTGCVNCPDRADPCCVLGMCNNCCRAATTTGAVTEAPTEHDHCHC